MLGQLLCIDRRYQRMNCFNIREAQSLLKKEFFTDLINSTDHRDLLNSTMISHRFKTGSNSSLKLNFANFIDYGTSIFDLQNNSDITSTESSSINLETFFHFSTISNQVSPLNLKLFDLTVLFTSYTNFYNFISQLTNYLHFLQPYSSSFTDFSA
jgi:hypothetical protein